VTNGLSTQFHGKKIKNFVLLVERKARPGTVNVVLNFGYTPRLSVCGNNRLDPEEACEGDTNSGCISC
jgi:hypothetical protein